MKFKKIHFNINVLNKESYPKRFNYLITGYLFTVKQLPNIKFVIHRPVIDLHIKNTGWVISEYTTGCSITVSNIIYKNPSRRAFINKTFKEFKYSKEEFIIAIEKIIILTGQVNFDYDLPEELFEI